jgi:hypothetical protein
MNMFSGKADEKDTLLGCCNQRHACYQLCGASKKSCEKAFKTCCDDTCAAVEEAESKKSCESSASIHSMSAQFGGCQQFDDAQSKACDCVKEKKAPKRREQSLTDFYKKHNREKLEEVEKLHEKHGKKDAWKFAKLMTKLVAKYPKAIKHEKSKEQAMYDDILNGKFKDENKEGGGGGGFGGDREEPKQDKAEKVVEEEQPVEEESLFGDDEEVMDLDDEAGEHDEM